MDSKLTSVPASLARRKQLLLVAVAGAVAAVGVLVLFWLGAGSASAQEEGEVTVSVQGEVATQDDGTGDSEQGGDADESGQDAGADDAEQDEGADDESGQDGGAGDSEQDEGAGDPAPVDATTFSPVPVINVPQVDADGDGANDFEGTQFEVRFWPYRAHPDCSQSFVNAIYVVQRDGSVVVSGADPVLGIRRSDNGDECYYSVTWPDSVGQLAKESATRGVRASSRTLFAWYVVQAVTTQTASVTISLPQIDENNDGVHDLADTELVVTFAELRRWTYTGTGCTDSATAAFVVQNSGSVEMSSPAPVLVLTPADAARSYKCDYSIGWPQIDGLVLTTGTIERLSSQSSTSTGAVYIENEELITFRVDLDVNIPRMDVNGDGVHDFAGTTFVVRFRQRSSSLAFTFYAFSYFFCSDSVEATYVVQDSGSVVLSGAAPVLVDRPVGSPNGCRYTVDWTPPAGLQDNRTRTFVHSGNGSQKVSIYASPRSDLMFTPDVTITVPQVDADGNGANDFVGIQFEVSFRRIQEFESTWGTSNCSALVTGTYVVRDSGLVELSGSVPSLIDHPAGSTPAITGFPGCSYHIQWPAVPGLVRQSSVAELISYEARVATANYTAVVAASFTPDVAITVPQTDANGDGANDLASTQFVVRFSPANTNCSSAASGAYVVQRDGSVVVAGAAPVLLVSQDGGAADCRYFVTWPSVSGLLRQPGYTALVRASARSASASYVSVTLGTFVPSVAIELPQLDADGNGVHDLAGTQLVVAFRPLSGSSYYAVCSTANGVYAVQDDGSVTGTSPNLLSFRAPGQHRYCAYSIDWPEIDGLVLRLGSTANIWVSYRSSVKATYVVSNEILTFRVAVNIWVPRTDANGDGANDHSGTRFVVGFRPRTSDSICSDYTTGTYVVQDDASVEVSGTAPVLVSRRAGHRSGCSYEVIWPTVAGTLQSTGAIPDYVGVNSSGSSVSNSAYETYRVPPAADTMFTPFENIRIPHYDIDGNGVHDLSGVKLVVKFVWRSTSAISSGCTTPAAVGTYVIQDNGDISAVGAEPVLVGSPAGNAGLCYYRVTWPELVGFEGINGTRAVLSTSRTFSATYRKISGPSVGFYPVINVTVPQIDANRDGYNDFYGRRFTVTFRRVEGSLPGCTSSLSITYIVQLSGSVTYLNASGQGWLIGGPMIECVYDVVWPTVSGLVRKSGATETIRASAVPDGEVPATANYQVPGAVATTFSPDVDISIPRLDADGNGVNDFSGRRFVVTFRRVYGSDAGCTASASRTYTVQNSGLVAGSGPSLVDRPAGVASGCSYIVVWPTVSGLVRQLGQMSQVSASARSASAVYRATAATSFSPDVSITVPRLDADGDGANDFVGRRLVVSFRRVLGSDAGCTASASRTYTVQNSGSVSGSDPSLVDRPAGVTTGCSYAITWPTVSGLVRQPAATATVSASARSASASYRATAATSFSPDVSITVPRLDADGDGDNDFSGRRFVVTFRRVLGSDAGCTASASRTYVVQDSGAVTGSDPSLVDRPAGVTSGCSYAVTWPTPAGLVRQSGATATVRAAARVARASYRATAATSFSPDVSIVVPRLDADGDGANDFSGKRFVVTFRRIFGSDTGCTNSANGIYVAQDSGSVTGSGPSLVDRPAGVSAGCFYVISWPEVAGLERRSGSAHVRASASTATASYRATAVVRFSPVVNISVPQTDADRDGANDFSGTSFVVTFRRIFGSDSGCTAVARGAYFVQDGGTVSGTAPSLVDRPAGSTTGCSYAITWPTLTDLVRQFGATATVSASAKSASAAYQTGPTYVAPAPEVVEPEVEDVEEPGVVEPEVEDVAEPEVEAVEEPVVDEPVVEEPEVGQTQSPGGSSSGGAVGGGGNAGAGAGSNAGAGAGAGAGAKTNTGGGTGAGNAGSGTGSDASNDGSESVPGAPVPEVGVIQLSQGWVMLPFNGPSGMTPADFAQALENAINSVWVWDMSAQQWQGWTTSRGPIGLTSLLPGDVVMVYAPTGGVVVYSPADLLGHRIGVNSWTLAPTGISLVVFGGGSATSASDVFASYANSAVVVYLWDSRNQRWEYHLPGRQPLDAVQVPWFSDINPGDAMFVYNISPTAVTIPWG